MIRQPAGRFKSIVFNCVENAPIGKGDKEVLVLSRKNGESIEIGDGITITVVRIGPNAVRLGVIAPKDVRVLREELAEEDHHEC